MIWKTDARFELNQYGASLAQDHSAAFFRRCEKSRIFFVTIANYKKRIHQRFKECSCLGCGA